MSSRLRSTSALAAAGVAGLCWPWGDDPPGTPRERRGVEDLEGAPRGGGPLGAGVELAAGVAQRQVGLGGEQQDQQRRLIADVTVQQPQADLDRDQRGGQGRGELQDQGGQERHPQRRHGRLAVGAGHLLDHLGLGPGPAEQLQRRQAAHHVEEVPAEQGQQPPLPLGLSPGVPSDQDPEQRDQRQGRRDDHRGDPVRERDPDQDRQRDQHGQHQLRQVPGKVGVQPVQALGRQGRDLPGLLTAEPGRA